MKKVLSVIVINLTLLQFINVKTYANCDMDYVDNSKIDFTKINQKNIQSFKQTVDDKEITVTRYEQFSKINYYLERDINNEIKRLITIENSKIEPNTLIYLLKSAYDLIAKTSTAQSMALNEIASKVSSNDLDRLSENEKNNAAKQGKNKGTVASTTDLAVSSSVGFGAWKIAKNLAKKGVGKIKEFAGIAVANPAASLITITSIGSAAFAIGGFAYNQFYILPMSNKLKNLIDVYKDIYMQVYEEVTNHLWIDGNVLITAVPTNTSCTKGYAHFHHIDGVHYNKSQKAINWEFAKSECKFLNEDHDDCYQEAKKTIECLWNNQDDPSQCKNNRYYYKNNGKYAFEL